MATHKKRYVMVIDSKKCIDCKACIVACRAETMCLCATAGTGSTKSTAAIGRNYSLLSNPGSASNAKILHVFACVRPARPISGPDGIVAINQSECVGCRYCIIACPYDARFFREDKGVVEKCDFCAKRVDRGELPACVETCPSKVRVFGDLNDPNGPVRRLLERRRYYTKKTEAGTGPQIYYLV